MSNLSPNSASIALLIDIENVRSEQFDIGRLAAYFAKRGRLLVRRAYGAHEQLTQLQPQLLEACVEVASHPAGSGGKNRADIRLVVDAVELALTRPHLDTFVVVSGDSDFVPLVSKLQELGKRVIVVARQSNASKSLKNLCDEFLVASDFSNRCDLAKPDGPDSKPHKSKEKDTQSTPSPCQPGRLAPELLYKVFWAQRLSKAVELQRGLSRPLTLSALVASFRALFSGACPSQYGFPKTGTWKSLLQAMETQQLLSMTLSEDRGTWYLEFTPQFVQLAGNHPKPAQFDNVLACRVARFRTLPSATTPVRLTVYNESNSDATLQPSLFDGESE